MGTENVAILRSVNKKNMYVALDETFTHKFNFEWEHDDIPVITKLFRNGASIWDIANRWKRDPDEVAVLYMDLVRKNKIKQEERPNGIYRS